MTSVIVIHRGSALKPDEMWEDSLKGFLENRTSTVPFRQHVY